MLEIYLFEISLSYSTKANGMNLPCSEILEHVYRAPAFVQRRPHLFPCPLCKSTPLYGVEDFPKHVF